jgi:esterase/lipase superfamily enzyme
MFKKKKVLLLTHGYNNEFEAVVRAYDIIDKKRRTQLKDQYDAVVGYTWPGGNNPLDWYVPKQRAGLVGSRFAANLKLFKNAGTTIDLMTHSLGARVALVALGITPKNSVRNHFLVASAVDNESIEKGEAYYRGTKQVTTSAVFHSKRDPVLRYVYRAAEWDRALGSTGPEDPSDIINFSPNVKVFNCRRIVGGHGGYKRTDRVYAAMDAVITSPNQVPQFSRL